MKECKCSMRTQLVGDGCEVCNPEQALEYAYLAISDLREELETAEKQLIQSYSEKDVELAAQAAVIEKMQAAIHEAIDWNWLDDDYPVDVYERLYALAIHTNSKEILAKHDSDIRGAVICNVLQCYSPDDSADDWVDKIRALADEKDKP